MSIPGRALHARTKRAAGRVLGSTRPGRRIRNSLRAALQDPDERPGAAHRPTPPPPPTTDDTADADADAERSRRAVAHTARDVTSIDPDLFALTFYSQFGEDAVVRGFFRRREEDRLRRDPESTASDSPIGDGFYVDVGCYHPSRFSNTMHFYDAGWKGINIDPSVGTTELFDRARPRDTTIEVAVSESEGTVTFYTSGYGGRSVFNTIDGDQAVAYRESGRVGRHRKIEVPALRLETILERHLPEGQQISFLDIDVEGHDLAVLRSNDWDTYRPIIVIVESHLALIDEVVHDPTYLFMIEHGYVLQSWVRPNMIFREQTA